MLFMRERTEASFEAKCIGGLWTSDGTFGIGAPLTTMEAIFFVGGLKWRTPPPNRASHSRLLHQVIPHLRLGEVNAGFYVVHCNTRTRLLSVLSVFFCFFCQKSLLQRRFPARSFWQTVLQEEQAGS